VGVLENSEFVTLGDTAKRQPRSLGYHGETIVNSLGGILLVCGVGFVLARRLLGLRLTLGVFVVTEIAIWMRDNLSLRMS
jgi:hypothetical protein